MANTKEHTYGLDDLLDIAMARIECGESPMGAMPPDSVGEYIGKLALELHAKGVTREQCRKRSQGGAESKHAR